MNRKPTPAFTFLDIRDINIHQKYKKVKGFFAV
jgi:hypothetical protein